MLKLALGAAESIALTEVSCGKSLLQPPEPLLGGAVGEGILNDISLGFLLEIVIADLRGACQGLHEVAVLQGTVHPVVVVCPYSGIEVRLQLDAHTDPVGIHLGCPGHLLMGLAEGSEQVLDVVSYLVGDDIGIGEITVSPDLGPHGLEEIEIEIDGLVGRTIERTYGGIGAAAAGRGYA